ncbi:Hint domain-containing protein [Thalassovita sp.]|uniref:Hint domain-containing protein n=1 Tax=Thalassovita sp. TaxID=1979401 RepID=UPI0029DE63C4|nr:Hint domain-containing protein [Thalassovita sp.]
MPTGYLVNLGDSSLDTGDVLGTSAYSFTTATQIGSGSISFTGRISWTEVRDYNLNGTYYEATDGNVYFVPNSFPRRFDSGQVNDAPDYSTADGVVDGTGGDDLIDGAYVDEDGDQVDSGAGAGVDGMGDFIAAGDGDDTVLAGAGDDTVSGGGGSDSLGGGAGNDIIHGDDITAASATSESLNWASAGADEQNIAAGFTQTTGVMDVDVSFTDDGNANDFSVESTSSIYVASGEDFNSTSSLSLGGSGQGNTSTTTISFATNQADSYADNVQNVSFRITDVDGADGGWQDIITINAVDANGNTVAVNLSGTGDDAISGNTVTASLTGNSFTDAHGSILVTIAGPVQSISIDYDNGFGNGQLLGISDVHFETIPLQAGDDTIDGGDGDDLIYGDAGADSLIGGDGADTLVGGDGNDTLAGGADGDSLDGGAGMDFLDYSGSDEGVNIDLGAGTASGGHAEGDTLAGGLDGIIGSEWDDTLVGYDGQGADWTNVFFGGGGNDFMDGAGGDDSLYGEEGDDTILGGDGDDVVAGGDGDDLLIGGGGADTLDGGTGNDTLNVGGGDSAAGGEGDDVFNINGGGGALTIDGGEGEEATGDTLNFGGQIDWGAISYSNTDPASLAGSVTLNDGTVVNFSNIENVIICFKSGTRIDTPHGPRRIEDLKPGDMVITRDNGLQPVRWIGRRRVPGTGDFAPIRFAPGALGNGRPLLVSPQHRMLYRSPDATLLFGAPEVLVTARHLVNGSTIRQMEKDQIDYVHVLFDRHEIIFAEGVPSESFHPGRHGLHGIMDHAREELFALFPDLRNDPDSFGDTARRCLKEYEAKLLQPA